MGVVASYFSDSSLQTPEKKSTFKKPKFYKGQDGPHFVLLDYNKVYETRRYEDGFWISMHVEVDGGRRTSNVIRECTKKLREYLEGKNGRKIHLGNSCAVICKISNQFLDICEITVSLALPEDYKDDPPVPQNEELFLEQQKARIIYVLILQNITHEEDWGKAFANEKDELMRNNERFSEDDACYRVTYDGKGWSGKGHKELWMIGVNVKEDYVCLKNDEDDEN